MNTMPKIALGAWSWGAGAAGGDQVLELSSQVQQKGEIIENLKGSLKA